MSVCFSISVCAKIHFNILMTLSKLSLSLMGKMNSFIQNRTGLKEIMQKKKVWNLSKVGGGGVKLWNPHPLSKELGFRVYGARLPFSARGAASSCKELGFRPYGIGSRMPRAPHSNLRV